MQRRAAAIYAALFLVVGAASYSLIATATQPTVDFENPDHTLSAEDSFEVDGQEYTVREISAEVSGGGHGGGGELARSAVIARTNESGQYTETWANGSTVPFDGTEWRVIVPNESDPGEFTLREEIDETAILENDSDADNETVIHNGTRMVVVERDGEAELVPAEEYFPAPETRRYSEGETVSVEGNETAFADVTAEAVTLEWTAPRTTTIEVTEGSNVTLGGTTYLAEIPDNETLVLTTDFESYERQTEEVERFYTHLNGLRGVAIVSVGLAVLLVGMAYLPSRY